MPKHSTIVAYLALFIALGGTSYAAVKLPKNSVGATQIKSNAVTSGKVKNGSLRKADFKAGDLPAGAQGPQGLKGDKGQDGKNGTDGTNGADGTARAFARIDAAGNLIGGADQAKGITQAMIQKNAGAPASESTGPGVYCIGGLGFTPKSAVVSIDNTDTWPAVPQVSGGALNFTTSVAVFKGEDLGRCDDAHGQARVATVKVDAAPPALTDHGFFIWLEG
jgi:hypothetical protein